jgi:hypothetical protein
MSRLLICPECGKPIIRYGCDRFSLPRYLVLMNYIMSRDAIRCNYDKVVTIIIMYECVANLSRVYEPESW